MWKHYTLRCVFAFIILLSSTTVFALAADPLALFTDNTEASEPTQDVTVMEQALIDQINAATTTIDLAIYGFDRASIRDALIIAHARGVVIRVVTDDDAYTDPQYTPYFMSLEAAGIPVINDERASIMHNKFLVIDGQVVWTGSTNLTDTCFTYNQNNSIVFNSTEIAEIFTLEFEEMFINGLFGIYKTDNTLHSLDYYDIPLEIYFSPSDGVLVEVLDEVNSATESIYFSIFYFTDDALRDALVARKNAGIEIMGVWDRLGASNLYSDDEWLCMNDIPIKIEDFGGKVHNKYMVIDINSASPRVITGSMNWTTAGDQDNDENTVIIHDLATAQAFKDDFQHLYDALGSWTLCPFDESTSYLPLISK